MRDIDPKKEEIIQQIALAVAGYKKGLADNRTLNEIADDWFDYLNERLDFYCT